MPREKIEKFGILRGNFPNPEFYEPTQPGPLIYDPDPSLALSPKI